MTPRASPVGRQYRANALGQLYVQKHYWRDYHDNRGVSFFVFHGQQQKENKQWMVCFGYGSDSIFLSC